MSRLHLQQAVRTLRHGGLVAYPTEAVYGLGCDPLNGHAVGHLLALKRRPVEKGLILIASEVEQLSQYIDLESLPALRQQEILASWPGPTTWLIPVRTGVPAWLTGKHQTLAVRVTAHPLARALCDAAGFALVSTSANLTDHPPARNALQVRAIFKTQVDCILTGATGRLRKPSEIRHAISGNIIRPG